ncbi:hypothetical protein BSP99_08905 [Corynebacterium glutamicum]|nr:hypothetical protein BSP99_08905 [Corynebacterium glutamicum]AST20832.1 hypothetical protein CEY17_08645 [Corynebacterium glutamicum ATCC 14067]QWQ85732.1 hypothetical protein B5C28_08765 [Corynebacterium glutamicum]
MVSASQYRTGPDRRDKIDEKVDPLARVSGFKGDKPNARAKTPGNRRILSHLSGPLSQRSATHP